MDLGEFELIERIRSLFPVPEGFVGIGDDCAVIPRREGGTDTLVSADLLVEGVHFLLSDVSPRDLGWKSAAVNFSDIAAMGGKPTGAFLSIALPQSVSSAWVMDFMDGFREMTDSLGATLLGGDTTSSLRDICINVTVVGECGHSAAVLRSGARIGDLICVTGPLGDSAAGLKVILGSMDRDTDSAVLVGRHYRPVPRIAEGMSLAASGVHSMMDISDGVASDLRHILKASGKGARVYTASLPFSPEFTGICSRYGWDPQELALTGGEDYELLFTVDHRTEKTLDVPHHVIGEVIRGNDIEWVGRETDFRGFRHF